MLSKFFYITHIKCNRIALKDFYSAIEELHLALKLNAENEYNQLDSDDDFELEDKEIDECVSDNEDVNECGSYVEVELTDKDEEVTDEMDGTKSRVINQLNFYILKLFKYHLVIRVQGHYQNIISVGLHVIVSSSFLGPFICS